MSEFYLLIIFINEDEMGIITSLVDHADHIGSILISIAISEFRLYVPCNFTSYINHK